MNEDHSVKITLLEKKNEALKKENEALKKENEYLRQQLAIARQEVVPSRSLLPEVHKSENNTSGQQVA